MHTCIDKLSYMLSCPLKKNKYVTNYEAVKALVTRMVSIQHGCPNYFNLDTELTINLTS